MSHWHVGLLLIIGLTTGITKSYAQYSTCQWSDTLYFRANSDLVLYDYQTNKDTFTRLDSLFADFGFSSVDSISITGFASSDGTDARNAELAYSRAFNTRGCLRWKYPELKNHRLTPQASVPQSGLAVSVPADRRAVIRILWKENPVLHTSTDPDMTSVEPETCTSVTQTKVFGDTIKSDTGENIQNVAAPVQTVRSKGMSGPRFAVKTNLLYWAALTPNVELEYRFAGRWSVNLEGQLAWWGNNGKHKFFRVAAVSPEIRYWITNRQAFKGHFCGAYIGTGLYEFMNKPSYGLQGEFYITGGLSYGYAMPIGKRLGMEFSIGIGYMMTEFREYYWDKGCYVYDQTKRQTYVGPTKAKISLIYPLGGKPRGGAR